MRALLADLLRCPACRGRLAVTPFATSPDGAEVVEGELACACGARYPIVATIPRMLPNAYALFPDFARRHGRMMQAAPGSKVRGRSRAVRLLARTQRSFGYQWTTFSEMSCDFRDNFWTYLHPATPEDFRGRLGLDAGCGFGRHIYHAAQCGAEMVGVDFSRAIDSTHQNTKQFTNVHLVQGDIYRLPFAEGTFDFAYSVGVLHHLPDPGRGLQAVARVVKPGGRVFVWLYSSMRRIVNALLEAARLVTTHLPLPLVRLVSFAGALIDWAGFVLPYRVARRLPGCARAAERLTTARIKLYSRYPFQVAYADWFDRLAAPIRFYYDADAARRLAEQAGLRDVRVEPTGAYGWRGCGIRGDVPLGAAGQHAPTEPAVA